MTLGDILDTAIALYRQNFALFAGIVALLAVPETLFSLFVRLAGPSSFVTSTTGSSGSSTFHFHDTFFVAEGGSLLITLVFNLLITGALARAISERYLGRSISVTEAYTSVGLGRFVLLALASLLTTVILAAGPIVAAVIIVVLAIAGISAGLVAFVGVVLGLAAVVFAVYAWVHLQFVAQALVIERTEVVGSLRRSWSLVDRSGWRVLGIVLVISILVGILSAIVGGIIGVVVGLAVPVLGSVVGSLVAILFQPFQFAAVTLLYYDLRVRKEGFDLEQLAGHLPDTGFSTPPIT